MAATCSRTVSRGASRDQWTKEWLEAAAPPDTPNTPKVVPKIARIWHWKKRWKEQSHARIAYTEPPKREIIARHKNLRKAESAIMIQVRTGKIGLAKFLHKANVPEFSSPTYRKCGRGEETAVYLLRYCDSSREERICLQEQGHIDVEKLLTTKEDSRNQQMDDSERGDRPIRAGKYASLRPGGIVCGAAYADAGVALALYRRSTGVRR